jgi:hypothetical protein
MRSTRARWLGAWFVVCAAACSSPTEPAPVGYNGEWAGTTAHDTPVTFTVSNDQVSAFTLAFNFSSTCSGTETIPGPVAIVTQVPPGPPPFDQPGFAMGKNAGDWGIAAAGAFSPDRRSVSGQFQLVFYPNCGTLNLRWSAKRR